MPSLVFHSKRSTKATPVLSHRHLLQRLTTLVTNSVIFEVCDMLACHEFTFGSGSPSERTADVENFEPCP